MMVEFEMETGKKISIRILAIESVEECDDDGDGGKRTIINMVNEGFYVKGSYEGTRNRLEAAVKRTMATFQKRDSNET